MSGSPLPPSFDGASSPSPVPSGPAPTDDELNELVKRLKNLQETARRSIDDYQLRPERDWQENGPDQVLYLNSKHDRGPVERLLEKPAFRCPSGHSDQVCDVLERLRTFFRGPAQSFDSEKAAARLDQLRRLSSELDVAIDSRFQAVAGPCQSQTGTPGLQVVPPSTEGGGVPDASNNGAREEGATPRPHDAAPVQAEGGMRTARQRALLDLVRRFSARAEEKRKLSHVYIRANYRQALDTASRIVQHNDGHLLSVVRIIPHLIPTSEQSDESRSEAASSEHIFHNGTLASLEEFWKLARDAVGLLTDLGILPDDEDAPQALNGSVPEQNHWCRRLLEWIHDRRWKDAGRPKGWRGKLFPEGATATELEDAFRAVGEELEKVSSSDEEASGSPPPSVAVPQPQTETARMCDPDAALLDKLDGAYRYAEQIEYGLERIANHLSHVRPMMRDKEVDLAKAIAGFYDLIHSMPLDPTGASSALPTRIKRALQRMDGQLLVWLERCGWLELIGPERQSYISSRVTKHTEERENRFLRAILTLQSREDAPDDPFADNLHDQALRLGLTPDPTLAGMITEDLRKLAVQLNDERWDAPVLSDKRPSFTPEEMDAFHQRGREIGNYVGSLNWPRKLDASAASVRPEGAGDSPDAPQSIPVTQGGSRPENSGRDASSIGRTPMKQPPPEAFLAYSLHVDSGWDQVTTARKVSEESRRTITQGQVSRWVKAVRGWREAGNPWPEGMYSPKSISTDPSKLDKGPPAQNYARRKPAS
jgi:hypothetical protein